MPKNVESSIRNVGHQPGDLDEIAGNIQEKTLCRLPGCLHGYVSLNTPKKRKKVGKVEGFVHLFALWSSMIKRVLFCQCQYDKTLPGLPANY